MLQSKVIRINKEVLEDLLRIDPNVSKACRILLKKPISDSNDIKALENLWIKLEPKIQDLIDQSIEDAKKGY